MKSDIYIHGITSLRYVIRQIMYIKQAGLEPKNNEVHNCVIKDIQGKFITSISSYLYSIYTMTNFFKFTKVRR